MENKAYLSHTVLEKGMIIYSMDGGGSDINKATMTREHIIDIGPYKELQKIHRDYIDELVKVKPSKKDVEVWVIMEPVTGEGPKSFVDIRDFGRWAIVDWREKWKKEQRMNENDKAPE
ncbi:hypothetical protein [Bacillus phage SPO1L5]|nr:hypothetical protein [Bacillus phage SPO1L5]